MRHVLYYIKYIKNKGTLKLKVLNIKDSAWKAPSH